MAGGGRKGLGSVAVVLPPADGEDTESETSTSTAATYQLTEDQEKRYRYLLGETELFDRFVEAKRKGESPLEVLTLNGAHGSHQSNEVHRLRRTEKDEDADLIQEATEIEARSYVFSESPSYICGGIMRPYQVQGLNWLISLYEHRINGILADEMGLGKTLQTLSLLGYLKFYRKIHGPHILVVPKSTLQNWMNETRRWIPDLRAFIFHGDKEVRHQLIRSHLQPIDFDMCITSYEICLAERAALRKISWEYLIIDEAHRIKNEHSQLSHIVREFKSKNRLLLTGTPLQNNLHELWALLNFLLPDIFSSSDDFDRWFETHGSHDQDEMVRQLRRILQPFLLRRLKSDVEHSLLPKKEINLYVGMTKMQRQWYRRILERDLEAVNGLMRHRQDRMRLLNIVMQLRKCCNHPYLFDGAEPGPPYTTDEHLVFNAGKMIVLDKLLARMKSAGSRVLLFSQMSRLLDILEDYCVFRGYSYCRIDGQTAHEERIEAIDDFNRPGSDKFIFLLTTRAGGLGINLATADTVILYDSDWNPQVDLQAQDRAHRIGQTKQVRVFRLLTENSIEEKVIERALQKLRLDQLVIQQGKLTNVNKPLSQDEMLSMIRHGADVLFSGKDEAAVDSAYDIEEVMRKGEERTKVLLQKYQNAGLDDLQRFTIEASSVGGGNATSTGTPSQGSEGAGSREREFIFLQPAKRERKTNHMMDGHSRGDPSSQSGTTSSRQKTSKHPPHPKSVPILYDFQFYMSGRLQDLLAQEVLAYQRSIGYRIPKPTLNDPEERKRVERQQHLIDTAQPLTEAEKEEKERYLQEGFGNWTRRDFHLLLKALEKYGRENYEAISAFMGTKTAKEVEEYSEVLWSNIKWLDDHERVLALVEKAEDRLNREKEVQSLLERKVMRHEKARSPLQITYYGGKGKHFTEDEDAFLIQQLADIGYAQQEAFERLRERVLRAPQFRFDWFIKTRTPEELRRRCGRLISFLSREQKELDEHASSPRRKKKSRYSWQKEKPVTNASRSVAKK